MVELTVTVLLLLAISFLCSVLESVILSITRPYIQTLIEKKSRSGPLLKRLKDEIEEPITAILTLNTISHTVGAAVSGAIALKVFGSGWMAVFSAVLTLLILVFSEIIPKTIGARHWKALGPLSGVILKIMIWGLKPVIVPIHFLMRLFSGENPADRVSRGEILNFIKMGYFQGVIGTPEFRIAENLFRLQCVPVSEIMTPRAVTFLLPPETTVGSLRDKAASLQFSRIPLGDPEGGGIPGVVLRRDIMTRMAKDEFDETLASFSTPAEVVGESMTVYTLLNRLVAQKKHIAVVNDADGRFSGIVTLEDALETLLGEEIVDEFDPVTDMRELARRSSPPPAED
jgi:CBS domain containing-hemolysin-like protein